MKVSGRPVSNAALIAETMTWDSPLIGAERR
jgi:hypothetical protein